MNAEIPLWPSAGSEVAKTRTMPALTAFEMNVFVPRRQKPPSPWSSGSLSSPYRSPRSAP